MFLHLFTLYQTTNFQTNPIWKHLQMANDKIYVTENIEFVLGWV